MVGVGAVGGAFSGLVGGGGGAVMIPLMTGVLHMPQHTAHGTSLVIIAGSAAAAAITYILAGSIEWSLVPALLAGSAAGAYFGATWARRLPALRLRQLLACFLVAVAARLLLVESVTPLFEAEGLARVAAGSGIGLVGGLASGALGVGGGSIFVPALVLVLGLGQHDAQGVSLCVIVWTAVIGALTHARHGTVDAQAARWIAPVAVPTGVLGGLVAGQLGDRDLRVIVSLVLVFVGLQMLVTATRRLRAERRLALAPAAGGVGR